MIQNLIYQRPELSQIDSDFKNLQVFTTIQGRKGIAFQVPLIDFDSKSTENLLSDYYELLRGLPPEVLLRFKLTDKNENTMSGIPVSRNETIREIGFRSKTLLVSFEWNRSSRISISDLPLFMFEKFGRPLSFSEVENLFKIEGAETIQSGLAIDFGSHVKGCYRIYRPGNYPISIDKLALILQENGLSNYDLSVTLKKVKNRNAESRLKRKTTKDLMVDDVVSFEKAHASESVLKKLILDGDSLFEIEWLIIPQRSSIDELRSALKSIENAFSQFGEGTIETFGNYSSFVASQIGAPQHVSFKEVSDHIPFYLPIGCYGESLQMTPTTPQTLLLHRDDGSIFNFDVFSSKNTAFNVLVGGITGMGKSVFGNVLTKSFLSNNNHRIIKLDVGGSYSRECALHGGQEVKFTLAEACGVDPFAQITGSHHSTDEASIIVEFLSTLALEEGEKFISKEIRADFEKRVMTYIRESLTHSYSDFLNQNPDIHRVNLLKRWAIGGIYGNLFKERKDDKQTDTRYLYYNFENIQAASNQDFTSGVFAAVIARLNLEILKLSETLARDAGLRLMFFLDETAFFIDQNFLALKLLASNFRKFGHSLFLALQDFSRFVQHRHGEEDLGLLINSPIKIFYGKCASSEFLRDRCFLSVRQIERIMNPERGKNYRTFVYQDDDGAKSLRLFVTPSEYLTTTTSRSEVDQINQIERALPSIPRDKIIELLVLNGGVVG